MKYKVIQSNSKGNAVLYDDKVMVDCGVKYNLIPQSVNYILLTHKHEDHISENGRTIAEIAIRRPEVTFICCKWMHPIITRLGVKNYEIVDLNQITRTVVGLYDFSPFKLFHDVENCGWRIAKYSDKNKSQELIFHATDTVTLNGIKALNYDLYALEYNFDEETIQEVIDTKLEKGEYSYEIGAVNSHLSWQKAQAFFDANKGPNSKLLKLHISERYSEVEV